MELRRFEVNGKHVEFVNQWRGNRSGFVHESTLFIDGRQIAEAKCQYYNRTWESYTYQTVMKRAVSDAEDEEIAYAKEKFMRENQYKKLTAERRAEFEEYCKQVEFIQLLRAIYAKL